MKLVILSTLPIVILSVNATPSDFGSLIAQSINRPCTVQNQDGKCVKAGTCQDDVTITGDCSKDGSWQCCMKIPCAETAAYGYCRNVISPHKPCPRGFSFSPTVRCFGKPPDGEVKLDGDYVQCCLDDGIVPDPIVVEQIVVPNTEIADTSGADYVPGINAPKVQANTFGGDTHRKGTLWDVPGQGGIASAGDIQGKPGSVTLPLDDLFTIPETLTSRIHRRDEPSSRHAEKFEKLLNWVTRKSVGY